jgi:hypothetical protein
VWGVKPPKESAKKVADAIEYKFVIFAKIPFFTLIAEEGLRIKKWKL